MIAIALLPGDGVGSEVLAGPAELAHWLAGQGVLSVSGPWPVGASAYGTYGTALPPETMTACESSDAILLGAVGIHPGVVTPSGFRPELALIELRRQFDLRISVREVWRSDGGALTFVRNLLGGMYGAAETRQESDGHTPASDMIELDPGQIREVAELGIQHLLRSPGASLISVDKANLLATSRLWRRVVAEVASARGIKVQHVHVDRFAYEMAAHELPNAIVMTEGLFGDILSDLACGRVGSIALCSSASINPGNRNQRCLGIFEPVHGSAPLHAGSDRVNPVGGYLALAALLSEFPSTSAWAEIVRSAVRLTLASGARTYELIAGGQRALSTSEVSTVINKNFFSLASAASPPPSARP